MTSIKFVLALCISAAYLFFVSLWVFDVRTAIVYGVSSAAEAIPWPKVLLIGFSTVLLGAAWIYSALALNSLGRNVNRSRAVLYGLAVAFLIGGFSFFQGFVL